MTMLGVVGIVDTSKSLKSLFDTALPGIGVDWFTPVTIGSDGILQIDVQVSIVGVLSVEIVRTTEVVVAMKGGANLTAGALETFLIPVKEGDTVTLTYSTTTGNIDFCELGLTEKVP